MKEKEQPGSEGLLGGACDICGLGNCARQQGKPCRFPQYMRHNLESLGGDVMKIAKDFFDIEPLSKEAADELRAVQKEFDVIDEEMWK